MACVHQAGGLTEKRTGVADFTLASLTAADIIGIVAIIATVFSVLLGVLISQWAASRTSHRNQDATVELTNQRILLRLVRSLEGEKDEDGFQRTKGFMDTTNERLCAIEDWRKTFDTAGKG